MDWYSFVLSRVWWELEREDGKVLQMAASTSTPAWLLPFCYGCYPLKFLSEGVAQATADNLNRRLDGDLMIYLDGDHMTLCRLLDSCVKAGDPPCKPVQRTAGE